MPAPEAKAACLGGDAVCSTFNPTTASTPTDVVLSGTGSATVGDPYTRAQVLFTVTNFTGSLFTIDNISIKGQGIVASGVGPSVPSLDITGNGLFVTSYFSIGASVPSVDFSNSSITFSIPGGLINDGTVISSVIRYASALPNENFVTTSAAFVSTAEVPGPLPLVSAGVAFGFSRKLRRRIATTA